MVNQWTNEELSNHSYASNPHYNIHWNGKVDINPETGQADQKIELKVSGMYRLVNEWLASDHQLNESQRKELIEKLASKGNRFYNKSTEEWNSK